jgi:hypothetical protein
MVLHSSPPDGSSKTVAAKGRAKRHKHKQHGKKAAMHRSKARRHKR